MMAAHATQGLESQLRKRSVGLFGKRGNFKPFTWQTEVVKLVLANLNRGVQTWHQQLANMLAKNTHVELVSIQTNFFANLWFGKLAFEVWTFVKQAFFTFNQLKPSYSSREDPGNEVRRVEVSGVKTRDWKLFGVCRVKVPLIMAAEENSFEVNIVRLNWGRWEIEK